MNESEFAAGLFRGVFGVDPPKRQRWVDWTLEPRLNDGTMPLYEVDKAAGRVVLNLHEGQMRAWDNPARFVFMIAGKQSGKTIFGPVWLLRTIMALGAGDYLAISATYDLFKLKLLPALKQFFVHDLGIARYWSGDRILELRDPDTGEFGASFGHEHEKMWGRIILRSADSEEGLQSASALAAWLDEPGLYSSGVWKDVRGRLSLAQGPALGTTTPYDLGWLKQQIYDPWQAGDPEIAVIQFSSALSPFFAAGEYESLRRTMQAHQFRMDYDAEFGRPPAGIYEDFVEALRAEGGHLVERFVIPEDWPRMVSIDPGIVNPGKLWIAHDVKNDEYYIYRAEKGGQRRTSKEHAAYDVARAKEGRERVIWWAVGAKSEKYWREDYKAAGANGVREPSISDVWEGIDRGVQLVREHRVFVMRDLVDFIGEILSYARVIRNGEPTNEIKDKSIYHLIDAYRYFAVQVVQKNKMRAQASVGAKSYVG